MCRCTYILSHNRLPRPWIVIGWSISIFKFFPKFDPLSSRDCRLRSDLTLGSASQHLYIIALNEFLLFRAHPFSYSYLFSVQLLFNDDSRKRWSHAVVAPACTNDSSRIRQVKKGYILRLSTVPLVPTICWPNRSIIRIRILRNKPSALIIPISRSRTWRFHCTAFRCEI